VVTLVDLSRCGESSAVVGLLAGAILLPHLYWLSVVRP
jgi:hypothetical protein